MNHLTTYNHRESRIENQVSSIEYQASLYEIRSTNSYVRKNNKNMQNEPNFRKSQMNVTKALTKDYVNKSNCSLAQNKANSKPNKANLQKAQMNVNKVLSKDYENVSLHRRGPVGLSRPVFLVSINERAILSLLNSLIDCKIVTIIKSFPTSAFILTASLSLPIGICSQRERAAIDAHSTIIELIDLRF